MIKKLFIYTLLFFSFTSFAETLDYQLTAQQIAKNTYVFIGKKQDFSLENGGNIVNTGFIVTSEGVVVIDPGPSLLYGQQMKSAIESITEKPIIKVFVTHHHPDHFFGSQAFAEIPVYALAETISLISRDAEGFLDNIYRMSGKWMAGTTVSFSQFKPLKKEHERLGEHKLSFITLPGHTEADLLIFDETTGVLFAGDLVFHNRAPTTPHANPEKWLASLEKLNDFDFEIIVPGHGEIAKDKTPIKQTHDYLVWLETTIRDGVNSGMDMNDIFALSVPAKIKKMAVFEREFSRSISHRYPIYENLIFD